MEKLVANFELIWPQQYTEDFYLAKAGDDGELGEAMFQTLYAGNPSPESGSLCREGTLRILEWRYPPHRALIGGTFWDTAIKTGTKNDYSVGTEMVLCDDGNFYVENVIRERLEYDDLEAVACTSYNRMVERFPGVPICMGIENASSGQQLIQRIERANLTGRADIVCIKYDLKGKSKPFRTRRVASCCKRTFLKKADWNLIVIKEWRVFPHDSSHDDTVDSMSIGYDILEVMGPAVISTAALAPHDDLDTLVNQLMDGGLDRENSMIGGNYQAAFNKDWGADRQLAAPSPATQRMLDRTAERDW
jgi:predicted phage terminase large subunit-like protein